MSEVKLFKLISSEEIVADVIALNDGVYQIQDAVMLVHQDNGNGQVSTGFAPFMAYASGTIELNRSAVASCADVQTNVLNEYKRIFSKIVIAPAGSI